MKKKSVKQSTQQPPQATDRHLETPSEANRDKHINFVALENNDVDPADERTEDKKKKNTKRDDDIIEDDTRPMHTKLTNNPRHATDESSPEADSPRDDE
jgi:hypothetical protein